MVKTDRLHDGRHVVCSRRHMRAKADTLHGLVLLELLLILLVLRRDFPVSCGSDGIQGLETTDTLHGLEATDAHRARLSLSDHMIVHHLVSPAWSVKLLCTDLRCLDPLSVRWQCLVAALERYLTDPVVRLLATTHPWHLSLEGSSRRWTFPA